ncbi:10737_t:CDS:2 [Funneliformis mosseae]|uniref:10737_t:CDS:1 n=1 Tax=Funneliformis mosseae TaxID=27381 RepID=A0A9N8YNV9_FUNMO|nr:10737_t:CDS:2 [Funneliformis mosseae]
MEAMDQVMLEVKVTFYVFIRYIEERETQETKIVSCDFLKMVNYEVREELFPEEKVTKNALQKKTEKTRKTFSNHLEALSNELILRLPLLVFPGGSTLY